MRVFGKNIKVNCISEKTKKLLVLSALKGVGTVTLNKLLSTDELSQELSIIAFNCLGKLKFTENDLKEATLFASRQIETAKNYEHKILSPVDSEYPNGLRGLHESPPIIFVAGDVRILQKKTLAIIGTREPTSHGIEISEKVTKWFVQKGWCIVSGLAKGVDTLAHSSALELNGKTAAVLAHGLDTIYPAENKGLADLILKKGGALLSEYPYGRTVRPQQLVQRDKVQAGLSAAVILIQSGLTGGSLHASRQIIKYGRPLVVTGQSKSDINSIEPKIQANLALLSDNTKDHEKLLKISNFDKNLLIKMPSKNEFETTHLLIETFGWWTKSASLSNSDGFIF